jgi:hypothetical protein
MIKKNTMIKRIVIAVCISLPALTGFAQQHMPNRTYTYNDEGSGTGFRKENLFVGGSLSLGFGGNTFNVGGSPEVGYSLNKWLDVGLLANLNYTSERADPNGYYNNDTRYRSFNYGAGVFGRVYPLPFLFLQVQPEYNWIDYNEKYIPTGESFSLNTHAKSLLLGIGYGQRIVGSSSFYIALLFDALSDTYSPYRDVNGAALPVIRAGFDFYLHPKR